jgi:hypothetical protein
MKSSKSWMMLGNWGSNRWLRALGTIFRRLRRDPLGFGELVKEYKHLKLLDHVGIIKPLIVRFGINLDARIVIISKLRLLSPGGVE